MDKLTSRSADSCIISGSDGVYMAQSRSLLTKCLIIAVWGKLTLYKYVACWLIAVSSHCLYLLFTTVVCVLSVLFFYQTCGWPAGPQKKTCEDNYSQLSSHYAMLVQHAMALYLPVCH